MVVSEDCVHPVVEAQRPELSAGFLVQLAKNVGMIRLVGDGSSTARRVGRCFGAW